MGLFPPWTDIVHFKTIHTESPIGYALILAPPQLGAAHIVKIDFSRLLLQWALVALAVGGGQIFLKDSTGK
jgi:hypothetical protein